MWPQIRKDEGNQRVAALIPVVIFLREWAGEVSLRPGIQPQRASEPHICTMQYMMLFC